MSSNLSRLAGWREQDPLFERLVADGPALAANPETIKALADEYLVGEAPIYGAITCYDDLRPGAEKIKAKVCNGSACLCAGNQDSVHKALSNHFAADEISHITCLGRCYEASAFSIADRNYSGSAVDHLDDILASKSAYPDPGYHIASALAEPMLTSPWSISDPTTCAWFKAQLARNPDDILADLKTSGLRGRGGAGFPAHLKWASCKAARGDRKYIICNADEGDPGAFIDRYILEHQADRMLAGMRLAAHVVGAQSAIIYIRSEYPESRTAMTAAIRAFADHGLSEDGFQFRLVYGAGAYICGEETALLASLEGRRPEVSIRPPYPTEAGLYGCPTVINNSETLACIPILLDIGADAFAHIGTPQSTGPKLVSLDCGFNRPGLYEVAMGTPLTTIIDDLGGGFIQPAKALQIGGPLGGIIPTSHFAQITLDFQSFSQAGFLLGHAGVVTIPQQISMAVYISHLFHFTSVESCGKCYPCRLGSKRGYELMERAIHHGETIDRELFDDLVNTMQDGSLCALGGGVPLPIRNALAFFADELAPYFTGQQP